MRYFLVQYIKDSPNAFRHLWRRGNPPAKSGKCGGAAPIKTAKEPGKTIGSSRVLGERRKEKFLIIFEYEIIRNWA